MTNRSTPEEISVKELMILFLKLWNRGVQLFLQAVLFVIKHSIPLVILIGLGIGTAYFLKDSNPRYKRMFIISTTEFTGDFLVEEINNINLKFSKNNTELKSEMSLDDINLNGISYSIEPIFEKGILMENYEYQYMNYLVENNLIDKESQQRIAELANHNYEIEMIYPADVDGLKVFNATIEYLRNNKFAAELHRAILDDVTFQINENDRLVSSLGDYVENLGNDARTLEYDSKGMIIEGAEGSDIGAMIYARSEMQKNTYKLKAKKVQLAENFRILNEGESVRFYGKGIKSKRMLVYPFLFVSAYLFVLFVVYIIRKAIALDNELKTET